MTAIKRTLKETFDRDEKHWVIYTDSRATMQCIEFNKITNPILNEIYNNVVEFHVYEKHIKLCKVLVHMGIKGTESADK